jgi:hypothetical protein
MAKVVKAKAAKKAPKPSVKQAAEVLSSVSIVKLDGGVIREYSKEIHGDSFKELAIEFSEKKGYKYKLNK